MLVVPSHLCNLFEVGCCTSLLRPPQLMGTPDRGQASNREIVGGYSDPRPIQHARRYFTLMTSNMNEAYPIDAAPRKLAQDY